MRIHFGTTAPVDLTAKALKKALKPQFPKLSLNRIRNAVARAYGYDNYTALQRNLSATRAPQFTDTDSLDRLSTEDALLRELTELVENHASPTPATARQQVEAALRDTRTQRAEFAGLGASARKLAEGMFEGPSLPLPGLLTAKVLADIEALGVYRSMGDSLYIPMLGTEADHLAAGDLDAHLVLYHGRMGFSLIPSSKLRHWLHGIPEERVDSFLTWESAYPDEDWGRDEDVLAFLEEGFPALLESPSLLALYESQVVKPGLGEKVASIGEAFEKFPPAVAKDVVTELLIAWFATTLPEYIAMPTRNFREAIIKMEGGIGSTFSEGEATAFMESSFPEDAKTAEDAEYYAQLWVWDLVRAHLSLPPVLGAVSVRRKEDIDPLEIDDDEPESDADCLEPTFNDLIEWLTTLTGWRYSRRVVHVGLQAEDERETPAVVTGVRSTAQGLELVVRETHWYKMPNRGYRVATQGLKALDVITVIEQLEAFPPALREVPLHLAPESGEKRYRCHWLPAPWTVEEAGAPAKVVALDTDVNTGALLGGRLQPTGFESALRKCLSAQGVADEALALIDSAERAPEEVRPLDLPAAAFVNVEFRAPAEVSTAAALAEYRERYNFRSFKARVAARKGEARQYGSAYRAIWSAEFICLDQDVDQIATLLKPILEWHQAEIRRIAGEIQSK